MKVFFLGWKARYEQIMIDCVAKHYDVRRYAVPRYAKRLNRWVKILNRRIAPRFSADWLARRINARLQVGSGDLLICNEGEAFRGFNPNLIRTFRGARVLLVRDLVDETFLMTMRGQFDAIYSFDAEQCQALGMQFLDQFFPYSVEDAKAWNATVPHSNVRPKCYYLGRDKGRSAYITQLGKDLGDCGCEVDFNILRDETSQASSPYYMDALLSYEANLRKVVEADVLVEVNQLGQMGLTLRPLEALYFDKKLITTNSSIKAFDFYDPARFYVLGEEERTIAQFIAATPAPVAQAILERYSPVTMLARLLADTQSIRGAHA